ncbi:DNA repair protein RecN [gut metagenome]|uniref:DNA repair protein RecN n=1 Tax=gut metagenome TaxID=749906 RepID=J9G8Y3_9ZZZZ
MAEFSTTERTRLWLEANELHLEDDSLMIRRTVDCHGRSRAWVNGIAVTVSQLRELGETLIDVHGQHAHQSLLKPQYQLKLLDDHAGTQQERQAVQEAYRRWQTAKKQLDDATSNADALAEKAERLSWMIEDLEVLAPKKGEWEALNVDHKRLAHAVAITDGLGVVLQTLTEGEAAVSSGLSEVHGKLSSLTRYDDRLADIASTIGTAIDLVEEAGRDVSRYLDRCDLDTESFERVDRRVSQYFELSRKFRTEPECLWELLDNSRRQLQSLTMKKDVEALIQAERTARETYDKKAKLLSEARLSGAKRLSEAVTKEMQKLAMKGARLEVSLIANPPSANGVEHCEFLIAGHAGVQTRPLIKVASGGELATHQSGDCRYYRRRNAGADFDL